MHVMILSVFEQLDAACVECCSSCMSGLGGYSVILMQLCLAAEAWFVRSFMPKATLLLAVFVAKCFGSQTFVLIKIDVYFRFGMHVNTQPARHACTESTDGLMTMIDARAYMVILIISVPRVSTLLRGCSDLLFLSRPPHGIAAQVL
jgi:hypothetical protein